MTDRLGQSAIQVLAASGTRQLSASSSGSGIAIKWHPGHYMASNTHWGLGQTISSSGCQAEISALLGSGSNVIGYSWLPRWSLFENTTLGVYDFSALDAVYTAVTGISKPGDTPTGKRLVVCWEGLVIYGSLIPVIPAYIYNNPGTYGAGSDGTHGGYTNFVSGTGATPALWRSSVMNRFIALNQAMGARISPSGNPYETDPYFEGIKSWELTAPTLGQIDYTESGYIGQTQAFFQAAVSAFPHTNIVGNNNYIGGDTLACANMTSFLQKNRCGISAPDLFGETCILNQAGLNTGINVAGCLADGLRAYIGSANAGASFPAGFSDSRGLMPCWPTIEQPEMDGSGFHGYGSPWVPQDFFNNALQTLSLANNAGGVSHLFWTYLVGNSPAIQDPTTKRNTGTQPGNWGSVLAAINANPIPFIGQPANYPAINTA